MGTKYFLIIKPNTILRVPGDRKKKLLVLLRKMLGYALDKMISIEISPKIWRKISIIIIFVIIYSNIQKRSETYF